MMTPKRVYFLMVGAVVLLSLGVIAATFFGDSMLQKQSQKLVNLKLDNDVLDQQQIAVAQAKKDVSTYADLEKIAKSVVPQEKDQAETVREIVKIASDNSIKLGTISFPASTLGATTPKPATTSGSTPAPAVPPVTQVKPVTGIPGVYVMEINIASDSNSPTSYNSLINFLQALEQNRRTAQVTSVTVQPNPQDRNKLTFSLVVDVYLKP